MRPDPAQLLLLREPGVQDPAGPQAPEMAQARYQRPRPRQTPTASRSQRWGWGRDSPANSRAGQPSPELWGPAGHNPQPVPCAAPPPPLTCRPEASYLTLLLRTTPPLRGSANRLNGPGYLQKGGNCNRAGQRTALGRQPVGRHHHTTHDQAMVTS